MINWNLKMSDGSPAIRSVKTNEKVIFVHKVDTDKHAVMFENGASSTYRASGQNIYSDRSWVENIPQITTKYITIGTVPCGGNYAHVHNNLRFADNKEYCKEVTNCLLIECEGDNIIHAKKVDIDSIKQ
jgi:hypothetical protein